MESENVRRHKIKRTDGNYYITVNDRAIMAHMPRPADPNNAEFQTMLNALCRICSKGLKTRLTLGTVAYQLKAAGLGFKTIADEMAGIVQGEIEEYITGDESIEELKRRAASGVG